MDWLLAHISTLTSIIGTAQVVSHFFPTKTQTIIGRWLRLISVALNAIATDFTAAKAAIENKEVTTTSKDRSNLND